MTKPSASLTATQTRLQYIEMIVGSTLSTFAGMFVGMKAQIVPGAPSPESISFVCVAGVCGWLFWVRRKRSVWSTIGLCVALFVIWILLVAIWILTLPLL